MRQERQSRGHSMTIPYAQLSQLWVDRAIHLAFRLRAFLNAEDE